MQKKKDVIFWDWNGTLLDDVDVCLQAMNILLKKRNMNLLDLKRYREVFDFPVKKYYSKVGFDFQSEPFEIPAIEFIDEYKILLPKSKLFEDVFETLQYFSNLGLRQFIVSAMERNALYSSVQSCQIVSFFEDIHGIKDNYANGKLHLFEELIKEKNLETSKILMIGDTLHDYEIAHKLGIDVILVSRGHQSKERLMASGAKVVGLLKEITANSFFT
jgi:phosphoglycolate phosphatase